MNLLRKARPSPRRRGWLPMLAASILFAAGTAARADFNDEPFDYRLLLAFDRLTAFTDVTARGGASAAHPLGSSVNPASEDFLRDPPYGFKYLGTLSSNTVITGSGAEISGESTTGHLRLPGAGTVYGSYIRTDMLRGDSKQGDDYGLGNNEFVLGYARKLRPDFSIGGEIHAVDSYLSVRSPETVGLVDRSTDSQGFNGVIGALYMPTPQWSFGLLGGMGWTGADTRLSIVDPRVGPMPLHLSDEDTITSSDVRGGVGYRPVEQWGFYADWQYRNLQSDLGKIDVGRMYLGAEYLPIPAIALRAGTSIDTVGKSNLAGGVGFYGFDPVIIEFGYAYNNFPEVEQEFGRAHVFSLSLVYKF